MGESTLYLSGYYRPDMSRGFEMYNLKETPDGAILLKDNVLVTGYEIKETKNSWKVRLIGASYGFAIGEFIPKKYSYKHVIALCVDNLREISVLDNEVK